MTKQQWAAIFIAPFLALGASAEKAPTVTFEAGSKVVSDVLPKFEAFCKGTTADLRGTKVDDLTIPQGAKAQTPYPNVDTITITAKRKVVGTAAPISDPKGQEAAKDVWAACTGDSPTDIRVVPDLASDSYASVLKGDRKVGEVSLGNDVVNVNISKANATETPLPWGTRYQVICTGELALKTSEIRGSKANAYGFPVSDSSALGRPDNMVIHSRSNPGIVPDGTAEEALRACGAEPHGGSVTKGLQTDDLSKSEVNAELASGSANGQPVTAKRHDDTRNKELFNRGTAWQVYRIGI